MNTQNLKTNHSNFINKQARFLMSDRRRNQENRRLSLLQRASEEIGLQ